MNDNAPLDWGGFLDQIITGTTDATMRRIHPEWDSLSPEEQETARAEIKARHSARDAALIEEAEQRNATAHEEHTEMLHAWADQSLITAVLELHRPTDDGPPECVHCAGLVNDVGSTRQTWPCATFHALQQEHLKVL